MKNLKRRRGRPQDLTEKDVQKIIRGVRHNWLIEREKLLLKNN